MSDAATPKKPSGTLNFILDFGPLLLFFVASKLGSSEADPKQGAVVGTATFMVAIIIAVIVSKVKLGKISPMLKLTAALGVFFGALTIWFHDERFIQIKPTIIYAFFALLLLGGWVRGKAMLKYEHLDKGEQSDFCEALEYVLRTLAIKIVEDGEGASKFVEIVVENAVSAGIARNIGRFVANSKLVKTAIFGQDPNWGRVIAALGSCEYQIIPQRVSIEYADVQVVSAGEPIKYNLKRIEENVKRPKFSICIDLGMGKESATVWTSDLTYEYVKINAEYTT